MNTHPSLWMLALAAPASSRAQGDLTPPGPPAPAMKSLGQLEPRTPITNLPVTITQPGSYYLATNLSSAGHGIVIRTNRVSIDLMGFSLAGDRTDDDYGIWIDGASSAPLRDLVVRNGSIHGFGSGIWANYPQNSRMEALLISSNSQYGIILSASSGRCGGNTIAHCSIAGNGQYGIALYGLASGQCNGNVIADCSISSNILDGIYLSGTSSGRCDGNVVARCSIAGNRSQGISLGGTASGQCNGNRIVDCTVSASGSYGLKADGTGGRCEGNVVAGCILRGSGTRGIHLDTAHGNRIEDNQVSGTVFAGTTYGISSASAASNLVVRNFCAGQTNNYSIGAANAYGPIVTNSGELAGGAAAQPWANFSR